ncbi:unnamed protein product [Protopolystoma xenopodis]|uniref:Uncharacterized protein n=1 Tax=Protopolystoma xenopodis TaxID=117903 RepID=A0A3S5BSV8_9PLAT|nr:unnamed protein product [Protopolystoma xenopodis]
MKWSLCLGAVAILRHQASIDFGLLMSGKLTLVELERVRKCVIPAAIRLPHFMANRERYMTSLRQIARINGIQILPNDVNSQSGEQQPFRLLSIVPSSCSNMKPPAAGITARQLRSSQSVTRPYFVTDNPPPLSLQSSKLLLPLYAVNEYISSAVTILDGIVYQLRFRRKFINSLAPGFSIHLALRGRT